MDNVENMDMEALCKRHLKDFKLLNTKEVSGFVKSKEEFDTFILELASNGFTFSTRSSGPYSNKLKPIRFEGGVPLTNIRKMHLECCHGSLYYQINKSSSEQDHPTGKKRRFHIQNSKKIGCQSKLNIKMCQVYPEYIADTSSLTERKIKKISKELREKRSEDRSDLKIEMWYFIQAFIEHNHGMESSTVKQYNPELPQFLHNMPHKFIKHMMPRFSSALVEFDINDCEMISNKIVKVLCKNSSNEYIVDFNNVTCTCADFHKWKRLCKHFCACFIYLPRFSFETLPETFRNNPLKKIMVLNSNDVEHRVEQSDQLIPVTTCKQANRLAVLREDLKSIIDMTQNIEDGEHLDDILENYPHVTVASIKEELDRHQKRKENLVLLVNRVKKRKKEKTPTVSNLSFSAGF